MNREQAISDTERIKQLLLQRVAELAQYLEPAK